MNDGIRSLLDRAEQAPSASKPRFDADAQDDCPRGGEMVLEPFAACREEFERIVEFLRSEEAQRMTAREMEGELEERREELMRLVYQAWLGTQPRGGGAVEADSGDRK